MEIQLVEGFSSIPGKGLEGLVDETKFLVVSPGYLEGKRIVLKEEKLKKSKNRDKQFFFYLKEKRYLEPLDLPILFGRNPEKQSQNSKVWE